MLILVQSLSVFMNWLNSTNAKEIGMLNYSSADSILQMNTNNNGFVLQGNPKNIGVNSLLGVSIGGPTVTHHTHVQIIHDDGSWGHTIRSLIIYGTGELRLYANFTREGSPAQRFFIVDSANVADAGARVLKNIINDPNYVKNHVTNWNTIWNGNGTATVHIDPLTEQAVKKAKSRGLGPGNSTASVQGSGTVGGFGTGGIGEPGKSVIGGDIDFGKISETITSSIMEYLQKIFEPVQVSFPIELLSAQINSISILLFILTFIILIFFISLLFNITVFIFSDKLLNYFTNKYIRWYLTFSKKVIGFEIVMLSGWIFYLLYMLLYGLHYIAIHPIVL